MWNRGAPVVRTCPRSSPLVLPRPLRVVEHQHALIVQLAVLVRLDTEVLPTAQELTGSLRCRGQPRLAGFGAIGGHELDLGVRPLGRAKVAACPSRVDRPNEVNVRRGHQRSIPAERLETVPVLGVAGVQPPSCPSAFLLEAAGFRFARGAGGSGGAPRGPPAPTLRAGRGGGRSAWGG